MSQLKSKAPRRKRGGIKKFSQVLITTDIKPLPLSRAQISRIIETTLRLARAPLRIRRSTVSVYFTNDKKIRALNSTWRGKDKATDVLSFSLIERANDFEPKTSTLGDIVISVPTAKRQAQELLSSLKVRLSQLLVHGTLHLLGYEHERVPAVKAQKMFDLEDRIMGKLAAAL